MHSKKLDSPPNILLIHADQHRWDCFGAAGNARLHTPYLDALAADGTRFSNCFCTFSICTPSRYSLLCGQYAWEHAGRCHPSTLSSAIPAFPRILRAAGYRTAAVGKMHFSPTYLDVGFDRLFLCEQDGDGRWDDDYHRELMAHGLADLIDLQDQRGEYRRHAPQTYRDAFGVAPSDLPEAYHSTTWIGDRAVDELAAWRPGVPNLLMAGFVKPHHPFDAPREWFDRYAPDDMVIPPGWTESVPACDAAFSPGYFDNAALTEPILKRMIAAYFAAIAHIDHQVGRMVALLRAKGLYDNTLIVYTSDHGDYLGFHHMALKGNHLYDPLVRIPLVIKYAGDNRDGGTVNDALVSTLDITATLVGAAGQDQPQSMRGVNLPADSHGHEAVFTESYGGRETMVRTRTHKLLLDDTYAPSMLFDLERDPLEFDNRVNDPGYSADRERLLRIARDWHIPGHDAPDYVNMDEPVIDQPNVPPRNGSHRPAIIAYYAAKAVERGVLPAAETLPTKPAIQLCRIS